MSDAVKGQFGYVLCGRSPITPGSVKPYEEVASAIKQEIAAARASRSGRRACTTRSRTRAATASRWRSRQVRRPRRARLPGVDREGKTAAGAPADVFDKAQVLPAVFASDVGVDDEPLATKDGGYVWFSVTKVDAGARPRASTK